ncbi:MAG: hypothetical protein KDB61_04715 [Planctomycetes bacterium]|nr:hypothetical protein [Planctomycetota bacterium]
MGLSQLEEVEYTIQPGWRNVWGSDESEPLEGISFDVYEDRATFEGLVFPVGTFHGDVYPGDGLGDGSVDLSLVEVNPLLALLSDEFSDFAKGVKVTGSLTKPDLTKPMDTPVR